MCSSKAVVTRYPVAFLPAWPYTRTIPLDTATELFYPFLRFLFLICPLTLILGPNVVLFCLKGVPHVRTQNPQQEQHCVDLRRVYISPHDNEQYAADHGKQTSMVWM